MKRMKIKEALEHPWLKIHEKIDLSNNPKGSTIKKQMSDFQKYTHVINDSDLNDDLTLGSNTMLPKANSEMSLKNNH